jgi:hypothetical protein
MLKKVEEKEKKGSRLITRTKEGGIAVPVDYHPYERQTPPPDRMILKTEEEEAAEVIRQRKPPDGVSLFEFKKREAACNFRTALWERRIQREAHYRCWKPEHSTYERWLWNLDSRIPSQDRQVLLMKPGIGLPLHKEIQRPRRENRP